MAHTNFRAKPQLPVLNRGHPLARRLQLCYPMQVQLRLAGTLDIQARELVSRVDHQCINGVTRVRNPYGWGLDFAATNAEIDTLYTDTPAEWSFICIFKPPTSATNFENVWYKEGTGTAAGLIRNGTTANEWRCALTGIPATLTDITDGEWNHFAGRRYGTNIDAIGNGGRSYASNSGSATIADGSLTIAERASGGGFDFAGEIAFFAFWDRKLSYREIMDHYADPWAMVTPRTFIKNGLVIAPSAVFPDSWMSKIQQPVTEPWKIASY